MYEKQTIINPKTVMLKKCFQYAITATLNHGNIGARLERITRIRSFTDLNRTKHSTKQLKHNAERENEMIFLIITHGGKCH